MPPWWVYKNHGERSDLRLALFLFVLSCNGFDLCGVSVRLLAITLSAYCCLGRSFYQVLVIVQRDGVEPLTLSRLSYVPTNLPVYPAGVRGVDLSV